MKILIVRTFPDIMNIHAYNVQEIGLAKALALNGHACDIVLYHGKNKDKVETCRFTDNETGQEHQYKIYWLKGFNIVKNGYMPSLKKILPEYDVIQVNEYDQLFSWDIYTGMIKPTVIYHGMYKSNYTRGYNLKCAVFDKVFLPQRRHAHVPAITKSKLAADFLSEKGFCETFPIGVGIDRDNFSGCDIEKEGRNFWPPKHGCRLLYIGKIEDRRSSLWMMDLLEELIKKNDNVELVMIGKGEKSYFEQFREKAGPFIESGHLRYIPEAAQKELARVYSECDIFLFPSKYEIFGMVLLESMYFGLPVISSPNGGASVLLKNGINGIVVPDFEISSWIEKIEELLENENKRKELGRAAGENIKENFLWTKLCGKFINVYEQAIMEFDKKYQGESIEY